MICKKSRLEKAMGKEKFGLEENLSSYRKSRLEKAMHKKNWIRGEVELL